MAGVLECTSLYLVTIFNRSGYDIAALSVAPLRESPDCFWTQPCRQLPFLNGHSGLEKDMFGTPTVEVNCTGVKSTNLGPKGTNLYANIMVLRMRTCLIMIHCPMGMTHYTDLMRYNHLRMFFDLLKCFNAL